MLKMTKLICLSTMLVCLAVLACPASAQTWDLAGDFSTTANPNGPWNYGALAYPVLYQDFQSYGMSTYDADGGGGKIVGYGAWMSGATCKNVTGDGLIQVSGSNWIAKDAMYLMPTSGSSGGSTNMIAQMWTSPIAGIVHIHGRYYGTTSLTSTWTVGGVMIWKGEYDNSANQTLYTHEKLYQDWIDGSVAGGASLEYPAKGGSHSESFFDVYVRVDVGKPIIFACGDAATWDSSRFGLDATIDAVTSEASPQTDESALIVAKRVYL